MAMFRVDNVIKQLREYNGLSQKKLCEGICSNDELSRIERGMRRPDWFNFEKIMQRLGEEPQKYYTDIATKKEMDFINARSQLKYLLRDKRNTEAEALIMELERNEMVKEKDKLQFLLKSKATLAFNREDYQGMYDYATKAIKITKSDFSENEVENYILFYDEIVIINLIATAHFYISSIEKSTDILLKLKTSMDKGYVDKEEKIKTYIILLYNISKNLGLLKKYNEGVAICDSGIVLCQKYQNAFLYPMILFNKAYCLLHLGQMEEGKILLKRVYALFFGNDRLAELKEINKCVEKEFGIANIFFDYSIT